MSKEHQWRTAQGLLSAVLRPTGRLWLSAPFYLYIFWLPYQHLPWIFHHNSNYRTEDNNHQESNTLFLYLLPVVCYSHCSRKREKKKIVYKCIIIQQILNCTTISCKYWLLSELCCCPWKGQAFSFVFFLCEEYQIIKHTIYWAAEIYFFFSMQTCRTVTGFESSFPLIQEQGDMTFFSILIKKNNFPH